LEFLTDWFLEGERKRLSDIRKQNLFQAAEVLGARHIKVGDFFQECGEGEFDVRGFVRGMQNAGYTGPWGIEVLSAELRTRPLDELTSRAFQTTMAQF
jgi:sugar phosphate isomerase/epimerase